MDSLKEDFSDSQLAEKIKSIFHEISNGLKQASEHLAEEHEFLESGSEEEAVQCGALKSEC